MPRLGTLEARAVVPVVAGMVALSAGLAMADIALVRITNAQRGSSARWAYERGQRLSQTGQPKEAVEFFRAAYNQSPSTRQYQLSLAEALGATGKEDEARFTIQSILDKFPADGRANIVMARMLASRGAWQDAAWYYHRGLFGTWGPQSDLTAIRFELADLLAARGAVHELLAETPLLDRDSSTEADRRHLGRLFLAARQWERAEELYRNLLTTSRDAELWTGLGRAQFALKNYPAAETSYRRAQSPAVMDEIRLVSDINAFNPVQRRLGATEKHRRAHALAEQMLTAVAACDLDSELQNAGELQARHERHRSDAAKAADEDFDLIDKMWPIVLKGCGKNVHVPEAVRRAAELVVTGRG